MFITLLTPPIDKPKLTENNTKRFVAPNGTTAAPSGGSVGGQTAGGCPPFDASACDLSCVTMDSNGCLSCHCPPSTRKLISAVRIIIFYSGYKKYII